MANKELRCVKCGKSFIFREEEQDFYKEKHFDDPKRCRTCRKKKTYKFDVRFITDRMGLCKVRFTGGKYGYVNDFYMD